MAENNKEFIEYVGEELKAAWDELGYIRDGAEYAKKAFDSLKPSHAAVVAGAAVSVYAALPTTVTTILGAVGAVFSAPTALGAAGVVAGVGTVRVVSVAGYKCIRDRFFR